MNGIIVISVLVLDYLEMVAKNEAIIFSQNFKLTQY